VVKAWASVVVKDTSCEAVRPFTWSVLKFASCVVVKDAMSVVEIVPT